MDVVTLCESLVSIDSVSARPNRPVCARIAAELEQAGARITWQEKVGDSGQVNVIAAFGPDGPGGLALAGHADTVPWDRSMRATDRPERDGRRLYGRGTCDMKGGIAAMVVAASVGCPPLKRPLRLAFTFQEEVGCHGIKHMASVGPLQVEHTIVGEPTGLRPVTAHKGYVVVRVVARGRPCHSSDPDRGISAIHAVARAIDAALRMGASWKDEAPPSRLLPPWSTLNVGLVRGGSARNVVPEHAEFTVEMRPAPGVEPRSLIAALRDTVRAAAIDAAPGVELEFIEDDIDGPLDTPEARPLVRFCVEQTGQSPGTVPFYTEAPTLSEMGATVVVCGPGSIEQAHRQDEFVEMDALEGAVVLYRQAIREFCT